MAQVAQARVQEAVNSLVQELDKTCLRKMQGNMHRCAASCCDKVNLSMEEVHQCIESCSGSMTKAQNYVQDELSNYQDRLQRCVMQCQDQIRDKITPDTSESERERYKNQFESCIVKCADDHVLLIPQMLKRMRDMMNKSIFIAENA